MNYGVVMMKTGSRTIARAGEYPNLDIPEPGADDRRGTSHRSGATRRKIRVGYWSLGRKSSTLTGCTHSHRRRTEGITSCRGCRSASLAIRTLSGCRLADQPLPSRYRTPGYSSRHTHAEELERRVRERTIELEAKNAWLEAILSGTSDGIVVTDSDGHIVDANQVAKMWLYHSLPTQDAERLRAMIRDLAWHADTRPDAVIELTGLDLELSAAPIFGQGAEGPAVVVAVHDVSYLKALDRVKSQFVSNVSHELRTPITAIRLYSSLIQRNSPESRQRYFEALDHETARLSKLVEDILQISRIEAGQLELNRRLVDLNMFTEMAVMNEVLAESRGLTINITPPPTRITVSVIR